MSSSSEPPFIKRLQESQQGYSGAPRRTFFTQENKILLLIIVGVSLAFGIIGWQFYNNYKNTLNDNYEKLGGMISNVVAVVGMEHLSSDTLPDEKLKIFVDQLLQNSDDIAAIEFLDNDGTSIYTSFKNLPADEKSNLIDFVAPLQPNLDGVPTQPIGNVHVKLTSKTLEDIRGASGRTILWVFFSAYFVSILAVSLNTYYNSKHLRTLVRALKRLSSGDFGYKITEQDLPGELRNLAESFNEMSVRLRLYEDQNLETITFERNKLRAILLSIADGVVVCDAQGQLTIINGAACQMLGFKNSEWAIDTNIKEYSTVEGVRCFEPVVRQFHQELKQSKGLLPEGCVELVELPEVALKVILSPIQDSEGDYLGFIMIMHDVTKETEVDKLKTNFISNVSHELRTPVTTIKSYVDTLYNHGADLDEVTYKEFIETINVETDRLKRLVNDILDFSRLDEGMLELEKEYVDISPVINLTVQSVKVLADQKEISVSTAIESDLPKVYINSDSIERVVRNLLSNAIKYTDDGGRIKVRAELTSRGKYLEVSVQDTGLGIPEEHLPHIFERFYRVENKVHTVKGTGLGLHLVQIAIEKHHHGEVFVNSTVGEGSTFGFRVPVSGEMLVGSTQNVDTEHPDILEEELVE